MPPSTLGEFKLQTANLLFYFGSIPQNRGLKNLYVEYNVRKINFRSYGPDPRYIAPLLYNIFVFMFLVVNKPI